MFRSGDPDRDELDRSIDAALASYGEAGADDRLSERILSGVRRRIQAEHAPTRMHWLPWAAGLATAACVLTLVLFGLRPARRAIDSARQAQSHAIEPAIAAATPRTSAAPAVRRLRGSAHLRKDDEKSQTAFTQPLPPVPPLPKQDLFPTPQPPSEEAEALAFFVRRASPSEIHALIEAQARADGPIIITELTIPPLQPLDEGGR